MNMNSEMDDYSSELVHDFTIQHSVNPSSGFQEPRSNLTQDGNAPEDYDNLYHQFGFTPSNSLLEARPDVSVFKPSLSNLGSPLDFDGMDVQYDMQPTSEQQQQPQQQNQFESIEEEKQQQKQEQTQKQQPIYDQPIPQIHFDTNIDQQVNLNMPGAFNVAVGENMDVDDSPQFTIESDLYFDPQLDNNSIVTNHIHIQDTDSLFKNQLSIPHQNQSNHHTPTFKEASFTSFDEVPKVAFPSTNGMVQNNGFNNVRDSVYEDDSYQHGRLRNGSIDSYYAANVINMHHHIQSQQQRQQHQQQQQQQNQMSSQQQQLQSQQLRLQQLPSQQPLNQQQYTGSFAGIQNKTIFNELSPLTTSTSHTPSVSSVHSTQPSFFSAQQYFTRTSLDQPPSSLNRNSLDLYPKSTNSMDNSQSQQQQSRNPRYTSFTNSITNILPFMGDKNQQRAPSPSPASGMSQPMENSNTPLPQSSRHLIRSIFKSSNAMGSNNNAPNDMGINFAQPSLLQNGSTLEGENNNGDGDFMIMSPTKEEGQFDTLENMPVITKKPKRSKRSLFTRFKNPTSKLDAPIEDNATNIPPVAEESKNDIESASNSIIGNTSTHGSSIGGSTPSISGVNVMDSSASEASHQQSQLQSSEPDYAALFENVGKRKNITYRKPKPKVKDESLSTETSNTAGEQPTSSSLLNFGRSRSKEGSARSSIKQDNASEQFSGENLSVASSNISSTNQDLSHESEQQDSSTPSTPTTSTIASASKRILGSKLMPKKKSASKQLSAKDAVSLSLDTPVATMISKGVEVEVDLRSLDLPPDTKIFPTSIINSKNRTRGRKENKEADMVDETKIYLCNYCSRRFKRHEHLKRHFRSLHTFEKPYDCSICHKKFSRSDNLNQHLKIHKQEEEMAHMDQMEEVEVEDE